MRTSIYWFRYDLRLEDNPGWTRLVASHDAVLGIYILPKRWLLPNPYTRKSIDSYRLTFLLESLEDLRGQLRACGSELLVVTGEPSEEIVTWATTLNAQTIGVAKHPGSEENDDLEKVRNALTIPIDITQNFTLFEEAELPFALQDVPLIFSQFRKQVEDLAITPSLPRPSKLLCHNPINNLPCELDAMRSALATDFQPISIHPHALPLQGGSTAGCERLDYYLHQSHLVATYKETRNQLYGLDFSSKLSPWLALGCISAKQVAEEIRSYERNVESNESTYWLYFELLWREYFQWLAFRFGKKMFAKKGIRNQDPQLGFSQQEFASWSRGETKSVFVNAFMRELSQTGWMSNRGRQIVASYLINDLGIDWRYGAAWFEQQLIDYDVAANWGNWQYLAGVGTDPRGRRYFNLEKQRQAYDPESTFIDRWLS